MALTRKFGLWQEYSQAPKYRDGSYYFRVRSDDDSNKRVELVIELPGCYNVWNIGTE